MSHRSYDSVKPSASKLLSKKWDDETYRAHRRAVSTVKPTVDTKPPKTYMHVQVKLKKLQKEEERAAEIERDNRILLEKMSRIMRTKGGVDHVNDYDHKSLNRERRQDELVRITQENQSILKRIQGQKATYRRDNWERDFDASQTRKRNITRFPKIDAAKSPSKSPSKQATRRAEDTSLPPADGSPSATQRYGDDDFEDDAEDSAARSDEEAPAAAAAAAAPRDASPEPEPEKEKPETGPSYAGTPTVRTNASLDTDAAVEKLRKAMKGMGTDEKSLIEVLTTCSAAQRQKLIPAFKAKFDRDLVADVKSETSGNFKQTLVALLTAPADLEASLLHDAIAGAGTDEKCLIEILASRSPAEVQNIAQSYQKQFGKTLAADIDGDTSGWLQKFLLAIVNGKRSGSAEFLRSDAVKMAKSLHEAGAKKLGTDEAEFEELLLFSSPAQLCAVCEEYEKLAGKSLLKDVESELSGDLREALRSVILLATSIPEFFADSLHRACAGAGTDDRTLIRIIVTRCEVDLETIKEKFAAKHGKSLSDVVKSETSGDYEKTLLALIGA